jgi:hypothetical protein
MLTDVSSAGHDRNHSWPIILNCGLSLNGSILLFSGLGTLSETVIQNQSLADSNFWESSDEGTLFKNKSIKNGEKKNGNKHKNKEGIDKNNCDDNDRDDDRDDDNNDGDCGIWPLPRFTWIWCDETKAPSGR